MRSVRIGGRFWRVADPDWVDPLDASFAAAPPGQRWNPPGIECLYCVSDEITARANVIRLFRGLPYGPEDLDPLAAPLLVDVDVPDGLAADAFTASGVASAGLPRTYPLDPDGSVVRHDVCQALGREAFEAGLDGVDARSAAPGGDRELAWFPRGRKLEPLGVRSFDQWW